MRNRTLVIVLLAAVLAVTVLASIVGWTWFLVPGAGLIEVP